MTTAQKEAFNLMLEDLHTVHPEIRMNAKKMHCEKELEDIKNLLINYLLSIK
jgi:hypothetical protein